MAYLGFVGDGHVGNFTSTGMLEAIYPAQRYAGRRATVETAGALQWYFSNGTSWVVVGSGSSLQPFTFQPETNTAIARMTATSVTPNTRRQYTINRMIKRLQDSGAWAKMSHLYILAADSQAQGLINIRNPGVNDLVANGTPTYTQFIGSSFGTINDFYDTGVPLTAISRNDVSMGCFVRPGYSASQATYNMGASDSGGTTGMQILASSTFTAVCSANGATVNTVSTGSDPDGMSAITRNNSANVALWHNSQKTDAALTSASVAPSLSTTITIGKVNGRTTTCVQTICASFIAAALTDSQMEIVWASVRDCLDSIEWGDRLINESGYLPATASSTVVVYGLTTNSIIHAYTLARKGKSVILVGGWRDRWSIGGMSANGLSQTDFDNLSLGMGGLPRALVTRLRTMAGLPDTSAIFATKSLSYVLKSMLDGARANGYTIPIYFSDGIAAVNKTGTRLNSITTNDGRTFSATYWHDGSYEGDLMSAAGVLTNIGREAAGTGIESFNGNRAFATTGNSGSVNFQFHNKAGTLINISPRVVENDDGTALLPGIEIDAIAQGAADGRVQAYNFRYPMTNGGKRKQLPATPPTGYSASDYELLGRQLAASPTLVFDDIVKIGTTQVLGSFDVNNNNAVSTDLLGTWAQQYTAATTNAQREVVWKKHQAWQLGLFYWLGYSGDSRIPASVITDAKAYGFDSYAILDGYPGDLLHHPAQLYIREMKRMTGGIGGFKLDANDLAMTDGTTPRSTNTIATASYVVDSHHNRALLDTSTTPHRTWNEGNVQSASGGGNLVAPLPIEIAIPDSSICTNLSSSWTLAVTHLAFGSIRMEFTAMEIAQAMGVWTSLCIDAGNIDMQSLPYGTFRPVMLAEPDAVAPKLPQTN